MKVCKEHWEAFRKSVDLHGLSPLVAPDGAEAARRVVERGNGAPLENSFEPLMELNMHFMGEALRCGGLFLMGPTPDNSNDGHYCPVCEFVKHQEGFNAQEEIDNIVKQMADWARTAGLIPKVS